MRLSAPCPSSKVPGSMGKPGFPLRLGETVCGLGFVPIIATTVMLLFSRQLTGISFSESISLLLLGVPPVFGIVTIVLAALQPRGRRLVTLVILGVLLVVWPIWGIAKVVAFECSHIAPGCD